MGKSTELITVKRSKTGLGLFACQPILKGMRIIQYTGELVSNADEKKLTGKYLISLNEKHTIDGRTRDNLARYVNHSCKPNAYAEVIDDEIWIVAKRRIKQDEEITFDYGKSYFEKFIKPKGCKCVKCNP
ncbi:MAG TPA: SET domain-containing protein [Pyrinomonadaceae bacterium]|jgi:hypothetical protein